MKAEKNAYLLGDYNINLLNVNKHALISLASDWIIRLT